MAKFNVKIIKADKEWDDFVAESPQGTIFSESVYLNACGLDYEIYGVFKGAHLKAGVVVILSEDGKGCELDDLVIYGGILFKEDPFHKLVKARNERFEITELVIDYLDYRFEKIELAFSPTFEDLRPFLWHNYHSKNQGDKFHPDLRYTSFLDISSLASAREEESLNFKQLDTLRQRNIREARKYNVRTIAEDQVNLFFEFYRNLMAEQGEHADDKKLSRMRNLIEKLLVKGRVNIFVSRKSTEEVLYVTIFCFDNKRAYYLFGAGNSNSQERYRGTICFWDVFRMLARDKGIEEVDMEGVNSPKRGSFKLSFGGDLRPYYKIFKM